MARGPVAAGGVEPLEVKISWTFQASKQQTGFALRKDAALLGTPQDAAQNVSTNLLAEFRACLPTIATVTGIDVVNVVTKEGGSVSPAAAAGTAQFDVGPGFLAAIIALKGELRTRYGQGRMFLPCYMDAWSTIETLTASGAAVMQAFVDKLTSTYVNGGVGQEWQLINWHPLLPAGRPNSTHPERPEVPSTYYDVTSVRLNPQLTSLRSRKQGVGS